MALVKCSECGSEVSDKAAACPKCGAPLAASRQAPLISGRSCPFCAAPVPDDAVVCTGCNAWYGYKGTSGPANPRGAIKFCLIVLAAWFVWRVMVIPMFYRVMWRGWVVPHMYHGSAPIVFPVYIILSIAALFALLLFVGACLSLAGGQRWYRRM